MPELNLDLNYFTHPKTLRLIGLLGRGTEVLPIRLWCYTGKVHAENGRLTGLSAQEIESLIGWWGDKGKGVEAMVRVGFIDHTDDGGYQVHDWLDHEGHLWAYKVRSKKGNRKRWEEAAGEKLPDPPGKESNKDSSKESGKESLEDSNKESPNLPTNQPTYLPQNSVGGGEAGKAADGERKPSEADALSDAQGFARHWISAEFPSYLRPRHIEALTRLVVRIGRAEAIRQVSPYLGKPDIPSPFHYLEGKLDNEKAKRDAEPVRPRVTQARTFNV